MAKTLTKSQILTSLSEGAELKKKEVAAVLEGLSCLIKAAVGKKGSGVFVLPGLLKILVVDKPAVPARRGINPFTKKEQMFAAKPKRRAIKVRPLKALKDFAK
jgi:nucleoid DNA-binding protein